MRDWGHFGKLSASLVTGDWGLGKKDILSTKKSRFYKSKIQNLKSKIHYERIVNQKSVFSLRWRYDYP